MNQNKSITENTLVGSIDMEKHALMQAVRSIIQTEIADEVLYESSLAEERLRKSLVNAESKLTEYILSLLSQSRSEGRNEVLEAATDLKFGDGDEYLSRPAKLHGISAKQAWNDALSDLLLKFRDNK